ncbi:DinB family protein [Sphingobacterium sp.]|uniref:DinB family protein n=1 Tax=Sphingobacterium sp. TaxID=341027 RepID=UPI0031D7D09B
MNLIAIASIATASLATSSAKSTLLLANNNALPLKKQVSRNVQMGTDSLLQYFNETTAELEKQVAGLSEAQLQFKPAPDKWSISQCLEHIIRSERMIFDMAKKGLDQDPQPERRKEIKLTDDNLKNALTDRSHKYQAPKELQPEGIYKDVKTALTDFTAARQPVIDYIKKADAEDLRNHVSDSPTGPIDGYQALMFIAAHSARHTKQIAEIKANPNFPKQ